LNITAHVGDKIALPANATHPLYFDNGTSTCIYTDATTTPAVYTFSSAGTYYFHCRQHATGCTTNLCGSTSCSAMAGVVAVSP
jgi:plastocyanin